MLIYLLSFFWTFLLMAAGEKPPNILFFFADDLGWNDVSFHGSPQIPTPNIDSLAASGIILNNYYVAPQCTPSRASLMTGRNLINTGLQHSVILAGEATALPLQFKIMPEYFKKLGYATHMVGKWHLGLHKKVYTPTYRGFDTFFGIWNGRIDYYDYTSHEDTDCLPGQKGIWGIDLHDGLETVRHFRGQYAQDVFADKAVEIIAKHNESQPLFLYMSNIAPHAGNPFQPVQATPERVARYKYIKDPKRREYAGVISSLDESLGKLFKSFNDKGMLENTIIVFSSDNGGEVNGMRGGQGSNWPFKGTKMSTWEGGVRAPAVLWSPLLKFKTPRVSTQMMHISDWLPTLYSAAGGNVCDLQEMDGVDMWWTLLYGLPSPRNEIILQIDPIFNISSLRSGDYKLVLGTYPDGQDKWFGPSGMDDVSVDSMDQWVWKDGSVVKDILEEKGWWLADVPDEWRKDVVVNCNKTLPPYENYECNPKIAPCLYNIVKDPCEYWNLARRYPEMVKTMMKRIDEYNATSMYPLSKKVDPHADPRCHGFAYVPWQDEEYASDCPWNS